MNQVIFLLLSCIISRGTSNEEGIFTSNYDLQLLLETKIEVIKSLENYIEAEELKLNKLKSLVSNYKMSLDVGNVNPEEYVSNPLNSFQLIKKLTSDFKTLQDLIEENSNSVQFKENITMSKDYLKWPSDEDLNGAAMALMRLQDVYKIKTDDLSVGNLNGVNYGPVLSANDCFEIGRQSYNNGDHYHTEIWMTRALARWDEESVKTVSKSDIYEHMAFSAYVQGNYRKALKYTDLLIEVDPLHERAHGNKVYYEKYIQEAGGELSANRRKGDDGLDEIDDDSTVVNEGESPDEPAVGWQLERSNYERLCRGEIIKHNPEAKNFMCYYEKGINPFLAIGPIKAEIMHRDPDLILYHDVLTDNEISTIKSIATPRFKRATVQNYKTGELETASYRISKTAWIKREEDKHIERIYQRVHDVTGLNMDTSEELQVSNYGIGGHYDPHFDFARVIIIFKKYSIKQSIEFNFSVKKRTLLHP